MRVNLFDFGRRNHLSIAPIVADEDHGCVVGHWLNGRVLGRYVSLFMPFWR